MQSKIYSGFVTHRRFKPIKHFFSYKTFSILIDLDELELINKDLSFISYNKFNLFSFYNKDHGRRDGSNLKDWVLETLGNFNIRHNISTVKLLCFPRILGYVFNPLSIFYCYDSSGQLKVILYEVKNTFNEQHTYIFEINQKSKIITQNCSKKFYVSPFIKMESNYHFRLKEPDNKLSVFIKQTDNEGTILTACQIGTRSDLTSKNLMISFFKHPLMTLKIIAAIHFEALRLWTKGAKFIKHNIKIKNNTTLEK